MQIALSIIRPVPRAEEGQDLLEYGLLAALIAIVRARRRAGGRQHDQRAFSGRRSPPPVSNAAAGVLAAGLAAATVIDLRSRRIPNELTAAMAVLGLGLAATGSRAASPSAASLAGFVLGLLLMMPGYALGATGAGDVKLMAAVGAIVGPALVLSAFLFTVDRRRRARA